MVAEDLGRLTLAELEKRVRAVAKKLRQIVLKEAPGGRAPPRRRQPSCEPS